jgi:Type IV secretion-system coupling protein DNA-binding domain
MPLPRVAFLRKRARNAAGFVQGHERQGSMNLVPIGGTPELQLAFALVLLGNWASLLRRRADLWSYAVAVAYSILVLIVGGLIWLFLGRTVLWLLALPIRVFALDRSIVTYDAGILWLLGIGYLSDRVRVPKTYGSTHHRGTYLHAGPARTGGGRDPLSPHTLSLAGIPVPPLDETKHFKLIGTTGTGKSTAIRELLGGALRRGDRAVIADPDGGYLARFHDPKRGDVILNPFDSRSLKWDLFSEIKNPYDFEQLARSLIPEGGSADSVWQRYAQTFLAAVMREIHGTGIRDVAELYRLLTSAPLDELRVMLAGTPAQPFLEPGNERMFGSIRSVAGSAVAALDFIQSQQSALFSIRRWVNEGRGVLFLPYQADQIAALRAIISTWMRIAIFETMSLGEGDLRLWFIVDELDALGQINGLKDALARLRKFGGRCVLGFQSIAQVSGTYGRSDAETIVENCGNTLILRCSASESGGTARFASKLIGDREIIRRQVSRSRQLGKLFSRNETVSDHHVTEAAVLPSQIEQLADLEGYLKLASQPEWIAVRLSASESEPI